MLSKRIMASSYYETMCPSCGYLTSFAASHIVEREFFATNEKKDYGVIGYDVKCQLCLAKFAPTRHRTANFFTNVAPIYMFSPLQQEYVSKMKSYAARVPQGLGGLRLNQRTEDLKHNQKFDAFSVFAVDEADIKNDDVYVYITGHNLNPDILANYLGVCDIYEVPVVEAMDFHFNLKPHMLGDVSRVTRT